MEEILQKTKTYTVKAREYKTVKTNKTVDIEHAVIDNDTKAFKIIKKIIGDQLEVREVMVALYLKRNLELIGYSIISMGATNGTVLDIKLVLKTALDVLAEYIIIGHNHPSGNLNMSDHDKLSSKKLADAAINMDIQLISSLIITEKDYKKIL